MVIFADVRKVKEHCRVLQEEQRQVQLLIDQLMSWQERAAAEGTADIAFVKKHLNIAQAELLCIRRRMQFLESATEKLYDANNNAASLLEDAVNAERSVLSAT